MIGKLEGKVAHIAAEYAIVDAGGIGYKVFATTETLTTIPLGSTASLWTHLAVRENALDLYGFPSQGELRMFELLMSVSGIGPKSALSILSMVGMESLKTAIAKNNPSYLTKVSGVGKKTAEKIVLELHEKVGGSADEASEALRGDEEALEALRAMGYSLSEARDALKLIPREVVSGSDRLREALKQLGTK